MLPRFMPGAEQIPYMPLERAILGTRYAWRGWIASIGWQRFGTFTFNKPLTQTSRDRLFQAMINQGNCYLFGRNRKHWTDGGMMWVRVEEVTLAGDVHFHALIRYSNVRRSAAAAMRNMDHWWHARCGHCRIEPVRHGVSAARYLLKHIKEGTEIEISHNFGRPVLAKVLN